MQHPTGFMDPEVMTWKPLSHGSFLFLAGKHLSCLFDKTPDFDFKNAHKEGWEHPLREATKCLMSYYSYADPKTAIEPYAWKHSVEGRGWDPRTCRPRLFDIICRVTHKGLQWLLKALWSICLIGITIEMWYVASIVWFIWPLRY